MKRKGYKASGKIMVSMPSNVYKKLPPYFYIEINIDNIKKRKKGE